MASAARIIVALALLAVFAGEASAGSVRRLEPYKPSAINLVVPAGAFREGHVRWDRLKHVLDSPPVAYRTADGMTVYISFSDSYTPDPAAAQTYVDLLGSYTHKGELNGLRLFVYTPAEIGAVCGANAVACYGNDRMFVSGTPVPGDPPVEQVLAHEYGHHIASHRLNPPWPARDWGPKHWANRTRFVANGKLKRQGVRRYKRRFLYDGPVTARVTGARGTTVSLSVGGKVVRGPARGVSGVNCGLESLTVVVRSKLGGRYHVVETQDDENG